MQICSFYACMILYWCCKINFFKCIALQEFADNLFELFDVDRSSSVSLQELVGGLRRLTM